MKPTPFFSIIIPTFNRAALLQKAIESVLTQAYTNWEFIVVDDGSTDNTAGVVKAFDDNRIRYVYQINAERSAARNNGIAHAKGNYICFLDSDDYYLPERLYLLHKELVQRNCPVSMFYTGFLGEHSGKFERPVVNYTVAETPYKDIFVNNVFEKIIVYNIHSQQVCISREILSKFNYDTRFRISEDTELWLRIAQKYPVHYIEDQYNVVVLEHDDRSVNIARYNAGNEQLPLYRYVLADKHSGKKISRKIKVFLLSGSMHTIAVHNIYKGRRGASVVALTQALFTDINSSWTKLRLNLLFRLLTFSSMEKIKKAI